MANETKRNTVTVAQLPDNAITVTDYCRRHDIDDDRARNACRSGRFTGAMYVPIINRWMIASDAPVPAMPESARTKRADGRRPYTWYGTETEHAALLEWVAANVDGDNIIIDPRAKRKRNTP